MREALLENSALLPAPKLEDDCYDWWKRHEAVLTAKTRITPEIVLIGDSITHFWGGEPDDPQKHGGDNWATTFGEIPVLNMGFGWDRTQNVLWRLQHGEFDGLQPRTIIINIGTNNLTGTEHARENTPEEICAGILAICEQLHRISPDSRIIDMGVFPRGEYPDDPFRAKINEINRVLEARLANIPYVTLLNIGTRFLQLDGRISPEIMFDFTHLTPAGYAIWAQALREVGAIA